MYNFPVGLQKILLFCVLIFPLSVNAQTKTLWATPLKECWSYKTGELLKFPVASDNDEILILPLRHGLLLALDPTSGSKIWSLKVGGQLNSRLFISGNSLYVANQVHTSVKIVTSLTSINTRSGIASWKTQLTRNPGLGDLQLFSDTDTLFIAGRSGLITAIDRITRSIKWVKRLEVKVTSNAGINAENIFIGTDKKRILFLSKKDGNFAADLSIGSLPTKVLGHLNNQIFVGDKQGMIQSFDIPNRKRRWSVKTGGEIVGLKILKNRLLILSNDNFVYLSSLNGGKKIWKRKLAGRLVGQTVFDNRIGVFLSSGSNVAIFIDLNSGSVINRVTVGNDNYFVSAPRIVGDILLLPTNKGLRAYSHSACTK